MVAGTTVPKLPRQSMTGEVLEDKKRNGKSKEWQRKKQESLIIAQAFSALGEHSRAETMAQCGAWLKFAECPNGHERKIISSNLCRIRLCSTCSWRRASLTASQVRLVAHTALSQQPKLRFLFLTLTVPNVPGEFIGKSLTELHSAFKRLLRLPEVKRVILGYFRAAEVKYSKKRGDYHPHLHILIAVPGRYFEDWYLARNEWLELWRRVMQNSSITQVDIRVVKPKRGGTDGLGGAAAEVSKYAVTSKDIIQSNPIHTSKVVGDLHAGLHRRRLTQFGGLFSQLKKQLKLVNAEAATSEDLVSIGKDSSCACAVCRSPLVEHVYIWLGGPKGDYVG